MVNNLSWSNKFFMVSKNIGKHNCLVKSIETNEKVTFYLLGTVLSNSARSRWNFTGVPFIGHPMVLRERERETTTFSSITYTWLQRTSLRVYKGFNSPAGESPSVSLVFTSFLIIIYYLYGECFQRVHLFRNHGKISITRTRNRAATAKKTSR